MNEEEKKNKEKKPRFYAALYSCVGVMLALAAVIGYFNFRALDSADDNKIANSPPPAENSVAVSGAKETPLPNLSLSEAAKATPTPTPIPTPPTKTIPAATPAPSPTPKPNTSGDSTILIPAPDEPDEAPQLTVTQDNVPEDATANSESEEPAQNPAAAAPEPKTFTAFNDDDEMAWPILGDIAMIYSPDHGIYDVTLELFRTNTTLCISAQAGDPVKAAAAGRVTDVHYSPETGVTMTIDHGNGWLTTYSRLDENVLVAVGDVVEKGEQIARIGDPPIFAILLGNHLGFEITKNSTSINPDTVLVAKN